MQSHKIHKYQAAGNDFILLLESEVAASVNRAQLTAKICDRHFGVGADGLLVLKQQGESWAWDFYNSDGSSAEMCGNAARCVASFLQEKFGVSKGLVQTSKSTFDFIVKGAQIKIRMPKSSPLQIWSVGEVYFIDTGVPHVVCLVANIDADHNTLTQRYRFPVQLNSAGANVTLVEKSGKAKTFERGVEGFTLACGTGAVAAAAVLKTIGVTSPIAIQMPGGKLAVEFLENEEYLIGDAEKILEGECYVKI